MSFLTAWSLSILGIAGLVGLINTARCAAARRRQRRARPTTAAACAQQGHQRQLELAGQPSGPPHSHDAADQHHHHQQQQHKLPGGTGQEATLGSDGSSSSRPPAAIGAVVAPRSSDGSKSTSTDGGHSRGRTDTVVTVCDAASSRSSSHAGKPPNPKVRLRLRGLVTGASACLCSGSVPTCWPHTQQRLPVTAPHPTPNDHQQWDWLSVLHCLLMEVATSAALIVTVGFWGGFGAVRGGCAWVGCQLRPADLVPVALTRHPLATHPPPTPPQQEMSSMPSRVPSWRTQATWSSRCCSCC
jgi:hypothetical protein